MGSGHAITIVLISAATAALCPIPLPAHTITSEYQPLLAASTTAAHHISPWWLAFAALGCGAIALALVLRTARSRRDQARAIHEHQTAVANAVRAAELSDARFRSLWESCPMGIHSYELQEPDRLVFVAANPAANRILGVDNRQFVGHTLESAFPNVVHTEIPAAYRRVARTSIPWHADQVDYEHGQIRGAFEVYAFPTGPGCVAVMFVEVTARRQAEVVLRESEERFRQLSQSIREVFYLLDWPDHQFAYASPAFESIWGTPPDRLYVEPELWSAAIHPADLPRTLQSLQEQIESGEWTGEYRIVRPDGSTRWIRDRAFAIRDASGHIHRLAGVAEDITGHHQAERAEQTFRRLAQCLVGASSLRDLAQFVAASCRSLFSHDAFFLDLLPPTSNQRTTLYAEDTPPGSDSPQEVQGATPSLDALWIQRLRQGHPVILNQSPDLTTPPLAPWGFSERRTVSILLSPIVTEARCIGVISLQSYTLNRFDSRDADLLQTLANHCASGIVRILAEDQLRRLNHELETRVRNRTQQLQRIVDLISRPDIQISELRQEVQRLENDTSLIRPTALAPPPTPG